MKSEGKTRLRRGQDKLEGRVEDEIEGREERKKVSTWWMDQQRAGQREGRGSKRVGRRATDRTGQRV